MSERRRLGIALVGVLALYSIGMLGLAKCVSGNQRHQVPEALACCQDDQTEYNFQHAKPHKHPPYDPVGMAQQEGRGPYADDSWRTESGLAQACMKQGGVALWLPKDDGNQTYLTCSPANVMGTTTDDRR